MSAEICNMDCFHCVFEDCINDGSSGHRRQQKFSEEQKQARREYQKKRKEEARAKGFCTVCCKRPATNGKRCLDCCLRERGYKKKAREKRAVKNGKRVSEKVAAYAGT